MSCSKEHDHESRATWYQSLYRLRIRTGIWTATLTTTLIILASSLQIWRKVLIPTALKIDQSAKFHDLCSILVDSSLPGTLCARTSFSLVSGGIAALLSFGAIVMHLLARRDAAQLVNKDYDEKSNAPSLIAPNGLDSFGGDFLPLKSEFLLAVVLSFSLGLNAVFATAVQVSHRTYFLLSIGSTNLGIQGPAATVGNL